MTELPVDRWAAVHLKAPDRRKLIDALLIAVPAPWWFVDLDGEIEVARPVPVAGGHDPCALEVVEPSLRAEYGRLLAATTARLDPGYQPSLTLMASEIAVVYESLCVPRERAETLAEHLAWIRRSTPFGVGIEPGHIALSEVRPDPSLRANLPAEIVARLAHAQAVRIVGPGPYQLVAEAAAVTALLASTSNT